MKHGAGVKGTRENSNRAFLVLVFLLLTLVAVPVFFGGSPELWNMITGQATAGTTNISVTINSVPVINYTQLVNTTPGTNVPVSIAAGTFQQVNFTFWVYDADGRGDINNLSARLTINITPRANDGDLYFINESRINTTCQANGTIQEVDVVTFVCSVYMWYWDAAGAWTINASINDSFNAYAENSTMQFGLAQTTAMIMSPTALTWPTLESNQTNRTSNNDPIRVNNTGNKNVGIGGFTVTGYDLELDTVRLSATYPESIIRAQNFSINHINASLVTDCNSGAGVNCYECNGTQLLNATGGETPNPQTLPFANMSAGNNSLELRNGTSGQENLFVCLRLVPPYIQRATYDTYGNWTNTWTVTVS